MERTQVLELMSTLKLYGMRSAYDEVMGDGIERQYEPPRIVGDLLQSEIAEKQARSIRYRLTIAKLPLAKDIDDFDFTDTPINESLVREMATGTFVADQRNVVLVGGTGTGKISPLQLRVRSSVRARVGASTMSLTWSTAWKWRHATASKDGWPITLHASTSSYSMNSAICRSRRHEVSSYAT
ncbi:hypothetical protein QE435_004977 [Rhizobium sp. SORGH_AS 787]|nr:hypothetical protein [Rhizobium sp. SORGH_AS_0787]